MIISFTPPVQVETDDGPVICKSGVASVAASKTLALRVVPVADDGTEYPASSLSVLGSDQPDIAAFLAGLQTMVQILVDERR